MRMTREEALSWFEKRMAIENWLDMYGMTREDASEILSDEEISCLIGKFHGAKEALDLALSALRPISREQVEKVWPGCPYCKEGIYSDFAYDKMCRSQDGIYCKFCGKPMTDDAVQMVMERMEALHEISPST